MPGVDPIKDMAAEPARGGPIPDEPDLDVLLSRQAGGRRASCVSAGYRVAYATPQAPGQQTPDSSTIRLFGDVLTVVGLEELVGDHVAHLPISRELLLSARDPAGPARTA